MSTVHLLQLEEAGKSISEFAKLEPLVLRCLQDPTHLAQTKKHIFVTTKDVLQA